MHLFFDLDGTLTDPLPGITKCIQHALIGLDLPSPPAESLRWCIGPPLKESFATLLGPEKAHLAEKALVEYRERFSAIGIFENVVYAGIADTLNELKRHGHNMHVATSKPTIYAERIIDHFGLKRYFHSIDGSELDGTRSDKTGLIAHLLERESICPNDAVMIGDREHDILGARKNNVRALGVLWGYGTLEELQEAGADACVANPPELLTQIK